MIVQVTRLKSDYLAIYEEGMLMYLRTLDVQGFKCFGETFSIELHDGLNVLVGENGAGIVTETRRASVALEGLAA